MTAPKRPIPSHAKKRLAMVLAGGVAGVVVVLAAVYGITALTRNVGGDKTCQPALALAQKIAPLARGEVAAVNVAKSPLKVPELAFHDAAGKPVTLAQWRGRTVLLNLWATWCVPCRKEMPALDALAQKLGGPDFEVVAINIDTRDPGKPKAFLDEIGAGNKPEILLLNKIDTDEGEAACPTWRTLHPGAIPISARTGRGIDKLYAAVADFLRGQQMRVVLEADVSDGRLLTFIESHAEVQDRQFADGRVMLTAVMGKRSL
jgi:thiol-disulfide isomerase/thioredoxin